MVRGLSMLLCLLGANVVLGAEVDALVVDQVGEVVDAQLVACNSTSDPNATVCPKYALADMGPAAGFIGFDALAQGNTTNVFGCCIEDDPLHDGGRCGSKKECEDVLAKHGAAMTQVFALFGLAAFGIMALPVLCGGCCCGLCCLSVTIYFCCCKSSKKKGGRQQMSDNETGSDSDHGDCPIGKRNAKLFVEALESEYADGQTGAVGDFLDGGGFLIESRGDIDAMNDAEDRVRNSGDPQRAIAQLRRKWGV